MSNPLISVIIPVFNVAEYIEKAVLSITNQTYLNLEIIIVDDGSTDSTYELLLEFAKNDSRIKLFKNEKNKRIVETLNFALGKVNGEYIARMDGDDISLPERIEQQYNYLVEHGDVDLVGLNVIMINEKGDEIHKERYLTDCNLIKEGAKYISPIPHFWLARRSLYEKVGQYRIATVEDYDFVLRCIDLDVKLNNLSGFLYKQRIRRGNTATASGLIQRKLIKYVKTLHKERMNNSTMHDSYSPKQVENLKKLPKLETTLFSISSKFHNNYIQQKSKNKIVASINMAVAILLYPGSQLGHILDRMRYKKLLEKQSC